MQDTARHSDQLQFETRNPDFEQMVHDAFSNQPFMAHLGAVLQSVKPGYCEIMLPQSPALTQHHGYFHGGVIAALADVCGGFAGWSLLPAGMAMLTVEYKTNIVAPGKGEALIGRGRVIRAGRTLTTTEIEILAVSQEKKTLCASALQTLMAVKAEGY